MDDKKLKRKLKKVAENKGDLSFAQLDATLEIGDKIEELNESIGGNLISEKAQLSVEIEAKDLQELLVSALEGDKKNNGEILNILSEIKDKKEDREEETELLKTIARNTEKKDIIVPAPNVIVPSQPVEIDLNPVTESVSDLHATAKEIKEILSIKEEFEPSQLYDKDGNPVNWDKITKLLEEIRDKESKGGGYSSNLLVYENTLGDKPLSGTSANGTRDLTSANTWYAVPSTVPSQPYILVVTIENAVGTVRFGFSNSGTPSATNGNQAPSQLTVKLAANQVIYYASSTAGDACNWSTKLI